MSAPTKEVFSAAACQIAAVGLAVVPLEGKSPAVKGFTKFRASPNTVDEWCRRFPNANIGVVTGPPSGLTVVDVDCPELVAPSIERYGETPVQTRTPSGGAHLWYRHQGEQCRVGVGGERVDIRGKGGLVVAPPSVRPRDGAPYEFVRGGIDDLDKLPPIAPGALPTARTGTSAPTPGERNRWLFGRAMREAKNVDDFDALLDCVASANDTLPDPLAEHEVVKIAESAWRYEQDGTNLYGGRGSFIDDQEFTALRDHPDALSLLVESKILHQGRPFAAGVKYARERHWGTDRLAKAKKPLLELGFWEQIKQGGHHIGDASLYRLKGRRGGVSSLLLPESGKGADR